MLLMAGVLAVATAAQVERPLSLDIWERQPGSRLDSGLVVDDEGTTHSRRATLAMLEAEPASAPLVATYRTERRKVARLAVLGFVPGVGLVTTPHLVRHTDAAEDAFREALLRYNTFGPAMDVEIEALP